MSVAATGALTPSSLAGLVRDALLSGGWSRLESAYGEDAVLDMEMAGGRRRAGGAAALRLLGSCFTGPARLAEWSQETHPEGVCLWFERVSDEGAPVRQRHYLRVRDGRVERHWAYAAPPRSRVADAAPLLLEPRLVAKLGEVVEHEPVSSTGWSGNVIERLRLADGRRLIAKRIVPGRAWIDRHTKDKGREALLFTSGVLDRLPETIDHTIVAAERDGEAWWVLMRDVSDSLLPDGARLSREAHRRVLAAANGMWDQFWGEQVPHVCSLHDCLGLFSPRIADAERDGLDLLPKQYAIFWEAFAEAVDGDVADAVLALHDDPTPLVRALDARGTTLVHADIRDEQIGLEGHRLILLDWGRASQGHPVVDFFWSICHNGWRIDATHDELVEDFRRVRGERDDPVAVDLGVIAGLVLYGWVFGHSAAYHPDPAEREWARGELDWWIPRARRALETVDLRAVNP